MTLGADSAAAAAPPGLDATTAGEPPPPAPESSAADVNQGSWWLAAAWGLLALAGGGGALAAQLGSTGRARLAGLTVFGLVGLLATARVVRQAWWLYCDQETTKTQMAALTAQMQQLALSGAMGMPGGGFPGGGPPDEVMPGWADVGAPPPGIPQVPGVTVAGPATGPIGPPAGQASHAPAGASSLDALGAWAGMAAPPATGAGATAGAGGSPHVPQYRPPELDSKVRQQAKQVKELLTALANARGQDYMWGRRFWSNLYAMDSSGQLVPEVKRLLTGFGYVGEQTVTAPRHEELGAALDRLASEAALTAGAGIWQSTPSQGLAAAAAQWVPRVRDDLHPSLQQVISAQPGQEAFFPITLVDRPTPMTSRSSRLRHRFKRKLALWALANEFVQGINSMDTGSCTDLTRPRRKESLSMNMRGLHGQVHKVVLREAKRLAEARRDCGLTGGALASLHVPSGDWAAAAFDESNAFSFVGVPSWMWGWQCVPPVRAAAVWWRLSPSQRDSLNPESWVYPMWRRLVMGSSHSVHILMSINSRICSMTLRRSLVDPQQDHTLAWQAGYQMLKETRVFVVMHLFAGARREQDVQHYVEAMMTDLELKVLMISVDLAEDSRWDLGRVDTFELIWSLVSEGLVDVILGAVRLAATEALRCDGAHTHELSYGEVNGNFRTTKLATYPPRLCRWIAEGIVATLSEMAQTGGGPTGHVRDGVKCQRITCYSGPLDLGAFYFLNETSSRGRGAVLGARDTSFYLHIDDGLIAADGGPQQSGEKKVNKLVHQVADALEDVGFVVKDRREHGMVDRIVGYEVESSPARVRVPKRKAALMHEALLLLTSRDWVHLDHLASVIGAVAMRRGIMGLYADLGAPLLPMVFASDPGQLQKVLERGPDTLQPFLPHLEGRVQPETLLTYRKRAAEFYQWCAAEGAHTWSPDEWGDTIMEYKASVDLLKSHFTSLLAAIEFKFPRLKGRLCRCHAALRGWELEHQTKHTVPMVSTAQAFVSARLSALGEPRLAIGLMLQGKIGMRPSEMLGIVASDLVFPEESGHGRGRGPLIVGLGIKANTKAKRPQSNAILEASSPALVDLLRTLKARAPPGGRMFPYALEKYRKLLARIQSECNLPMGWTPHSARAGFASEATARGMSFEQIRETCRWKVDSSLRVYIDMVQAAHIAVGLKAAGDDTDGQIEHATAITFLYRELVLGTTELPTYAG
ncbi:unnamed protein product [Prorocentrum cordatum]|uniref:Uncharacterized protein n=1 Tax=Prorocentrum cordatum TaxID=2364126 RepID=A0ABN9PF63_9DINO|nr:unnamed protein product [Polarella glacialis]